MSASGLIKRLFRAFFMADRYFATRHSSPKIYNGSGYKRGKFPHPSKTKWMVEEMQDHIIKIKPKLIFGFPENPMVKDKFKRLNKWINENYDSLDEKELGAAFGEIEEKYFLPIRVLKRTCAEVS